MKENLLVGDGHLSDLFLRWKADPQRWEREMLETIDKIITAAVGSHFRFSTSYKAYESSADLRQELRIFCFERVLPRIRYTQVPGACTVELNKALYNYLKWSIIWQMQKYRKRAAIRRERESQIYARCEDAIKTRKDVGSIEAHLAHFEEGTQKIAQLLVEGNKKSTICRKLKMKPSEFDERLQVLQDYYRELGYGNE